MKKPKNQNQKIFLITLIILSTLLIHTGLVNAEDNLEECNAQGGIWCAYNVNCIGANQDHYENPDTVCVVTESQNVTLSQSQTKYTIDNPKIFEFKELEIKSGVLLQFYNAPYDPNFAAPSAVGPDTKSRLANNALDAIIKGGYGGKGYGPLGRLSCPGGYCWSCGGFNPHSSTNRKYGAGGAAGAAGGQIGQHGGTALDFYGNRGENTAGTQGKGFEGGRAGGFVRLILQDLDLQGDLSVSGEDGKKGTDATGSSSTNDGAPGGGPGSGGGGAGQIELNILNDIHGSGVILANGGKGGDGGAGGLGASRRYCSTSDWGRLHGGGGGAGGGGSAGNVIFLNIETAHQCVPGNGGAGGSGQCSTCSNYHLGGYESCCSVDGGSGTRGEYSQTCGSRTLEWSPYPDRIEEGEFEFLTLEQKKEFIKQYCNSENDSDGDGLPDMADPDCYDMFDSTYGAANIMVWDSFIRNIHGHPIASTDLSWFNPSASDGHDLVCGDDLPSFQQQETNNEAEGQCVGEIYLGCEFTTDGSSDGLEEHVTRKCMDYWNQYGGGGCISAPDYCIRNSERDTPIGEQMDNHCVSVENPQCSMFNQETCTISGTTEIGGESYPYQFGAMCQDKGFNQCSDLSPQSESYCLAHNGCTWQGESNNNNDDDDGEFTMGDLGFITPDGDFACFDNTNNPRAEQDQNEMTTEPNLRAPGNNYTWRDSMRNLAKIMRAHNTMFISNSDDWFYCDVVQNSGLTSDLKISEYEFLEVAQSASTPSCSAKLSTFLEKTIIDCEAYDGTEFIGDYECEDNYDDDNPIDHDGYCETLSEDEIRRFDATIPNFIEECGACMINEGQDDELISFQEYISINSDGTPDEGYDEFINAYCTQYNHDAFFCNPDQQDAGQGFLGSQFCKQNREACLGTAFSTDSSCNDIHTNFGYSYSSYKLCDLTQEYCQGGFLTESSDTEGVCCVGPSSYCAPIADLTCLDMGGETFEDEIEICLGENIELGDGSQCCFGTVRPSQNFMLPNILSDKGFICYSHSEKGFISECCGPGGCVNKDNPLNRGRDLLSHTYTMTGATYHMLASFDSNDLGENVISIEITENFEGEFSFKDELKDSPLTSFMSSFSVEGFDYLEFDFLTNGKQYLDEIQLKDINNRIWSFDFKEHLTAEDFRWQRLKLDLSQPPTNFNKQEILDVVFTFDSNANFQFAADRLHLTSKNSEMNSDTRICTGGWGEWIDNLDGPTTDRGFFENENPILEEVINDYGPYRDACDASMSFAWTGSACCGDDTHKEFGENGEYWIDTRGVCWNGTAVRHDQTLAFELSKEYKERSRLEKSLLFHGGQTWICQYDKDEYDENYRFNTNDELTTTISSKILDEQVVAPFTIKGGWMCEGGEGWTRIGDVNRITLLASFLLNEAVEQEYEDEFTIHCGDKLRVTNYLVPETQQDYDKVLGNFCLLRTGKNTDFIEAGGDGIGIPRGDIFLAFESKAMNVSVLEELNNTILKAFPALYDANIDCTNAPSNTLDDNFFTECELDSQYFDGTIYYNRPLQIALITSEEVKTQSFFQNMWNNFLNFFKNLFGGDDDEETQFYDLKDFSSFENSNELYISKQGEKLIVGKSEVLIPAQKIRIDYTNLATNVSFLASNLNREQGDTLALWVPNEYTQTIFTLAQEEENFLNFNELTSMLRLVNTGTQVNFGTQSSCLINFANTQEEWESGTQELVYQVPSSLNCNAETKKIMCFNGQVLDENLQTINTQNYYTICNHELPSITQHELTLSITGQGTIIANTQTITDTTTLTYNEGTTITLTAQINDEWEFVEWIGYEGENTQEITFTLNNDMSIELKLQQNLDSSGGTETNECSGINCDICQECVNGECIPTSNEWHLNPVWQPWGITQTEIDINMDSSKHHHQGIYCKNGNPIYNACISETHTNQDIQNICNNIKCLYEHTTDNGVETGCKGTPGSCSGFVMGPSNDIPGEYGCETSEVACAQETLLQDEYYVPECPTTSTSGGSGGTGNPSDPENQNTEEQAQQ